MPMAAPESGGAESSWATPSSSDETSPASADGQG
jgi:hypothetical protein